MAASTARWRFSERKWHYVCILALAGLLKLARTSGSWAGGGKLLCTVNPWPWRYDAVRWWRRCAQGSNGVWELKWGEASRSVTKATKWWQRCQLFSMRRGRRGNRRGNKINRKGSFLSEGMSCLDRRRILDCVSLFVPRRKKNIPCSCSVEEPEEPAAPATTLWENVDFSSPLWIHGML